MLHRPWLTLVSPVGPRRALLSIIQDNTAFQPNIEVRNAVPAGPMVKVFTAIPLLPSQFRKCSCDFVDLRRIRAVFELLTRKPLLESLNGVQWYAHIHNSGNAPPSFISYLLPVFFPQVLICMLIASFVFDRVSLIKPSKVKQTKYHVTVLVTCTKWLGSSRLA